MSRLRASEAQNEPGPSINATCLSPDVHSEVAYNRSLAIQYFWLKDPIIVIARLLILGLSFYYLPSSHDHHYHRPPNSSTLTCCLSTMLPLITLEEHYSSPKVLESSKSIGAFYNPFPPHMLHKLRSLGGERIQYLDQGEVSLQVISHDPGEASPSVCKAANDDLAAAVSKHPTRLVGFAMITMSQPAVAARELTRCVQELGFVGALVENHVDGEFCDGERFWPIFETTQELDVPIYIHPLLQPA
jgi:hypothetical protein